MDWGVWRDEELQVELSQQLRQRKVGVCLDWGVRRLQSELPQVKKNVDRGVWRDPSYSSAKGKMEYCMCGLGSSERGMTSGGTPSASQVKESGSTSTGV